MTELKNSVIFWQIWSLDPTRPTGQPDPCPALGHPPGSRLPLLSVRPAVTFPAGSRASPPIGRYQIILLGDRGTCVCATCPRLLPGSGPAEIRTRRPLGSRVNDLPLRHTGHTTIQWVRGQLWLSLKAKTKGGLHQPHLNRHLTNGHLTLSSH